MAKVKVRKGLRFGKWVLEFFEAETGHAGMGLRIRLLGSKLSRGWGGRTEAG